MMSDHKKKNEKNPPEFDANSQPEKHVDVKQKRVRLSPEVRRRQILDAALIEFSNLGFTAASTAKIAKRAGTSKANIYAHFADKDEIFETLLRELLAPNKSNSFFLLPDSNLDEQINNYIDSVYDGLSPQVIAVIRLMIAESHRVPSLIRRWHNEVIVPAHEEQQQRIDRYIEEGHIDNNPLTRHFSMAVAPVVYAVMACAVFEDDIVNGEFQRIKETHRQLLHLLLKPPVSHT